MPDTSVLLIHPASHTTGSVERFYGIVNGGGANQAGHFGTLHAKMMRDVGNVLGGVGAGERSAVWVSEDTGFATVVAAGSPSAADISAGICTHILINHNVADATWLGKMGKPAGATGANPGRATMAARLLSLLSSFGPWGNPCNLTIKEYGATDSIRAQAGVAF